jgi:hypothetical protein
VTFPRIARRVPTLCTDAVSVHAATPPASGEMRPYMAPSAWVPHPNRGAFAARAATLNLRLSTFLLAI